MLIDIVKAIQRDQLIRQAGVLAGAGEIDSVEFRARFSRLLNFAQKFGSLTALRDSALPSCSSSCDADHVELGQVEVISLSAQTPGCVAQADTEKDGSRAGSPEEQSGTSKMRSSAVVRSESPIHVVRRPLDNVNLLQPTPGRPPPQVPPAYLRKVSVSQHCGRSSRSSMGAFKIPRTVSLSLGPAQSARAHRFDPVLTLSPPTPGRMAQAYAEKSCPRSGYQANHSGSMKCPSGGVLSASKLRALSPCQSRESGSPPQATLVRTPSEVFGPFLRKVKSTQNLGLSDPAAGVGTSALGYAQSIPAHHVAQDMYINFRPAAFQSAGGLAKSLLTPPRQNRVVRVQSS